MVCVWVCVWVWVWTLERGINKDVRALWQVCMRINCVLVIGRELKIFIVDDQGSPVHVHGTTPEPPFVSKVYMRLYVLLFVQPQTAEFLYKIMVICAFYDF